MPEKCPSRGVPVFYKRTIDKSKTFGGFENEHTNTEFNAEKQISFQMERRQLGDFLRRCFFGRQYFDVSFRQRFLFPFYRIYSLFSRCARRRISERDVGISRITGTRSVSAVYNGRFGDFIFCLLVLFQKESRMIDCRHRVFCA